MTKIEEVARAICEGSGQIWGGPHGPDDPDFLVYKHAYYRMARAAIEAMRKPTPRMLQAACAAMSPGKRPTSTYISAKAKHGVRYRAMIDVALEDQ